MISLLSVTSIFHSSDTTKLIDMVSQISKDLRYGQSSDARIDDNMAWCNKDTHFHVHMSLAEEEMRLPFLQNVMALYVSRTDGQYSCLPTIDLLVY
jgi:hypothetical protein